MAVVTAGKAEEGRVLLENIRWSTYEALLHDLGPHPGRRVTYDRGLLEIMTTSSLHERLKKLLGRFVETMTLELGLKILSVGSATWKRADLKRGFEGDETYYIANEEAVRGCSDIELPRDPPPDLVIEVEISPSALGRQGIYADFGVPELWRHDGGKVRFYALLEAGGYRESQKSIAFPFLAASDLNRFLGMQGVLDETGLLESFRTWVRETLKKG